MSDKTDGARSSVSTSFVKFVYDSDNGAIFTRTPASWAKIITFYLIYYSCLAGFFAGLLKIFLIYFTDDVAPSLVGNVSILPQNPGMGFRPQPDIEQTLVSFRPSDRESWKKYAEAMDEFLDTKKEDVKTTYRRGQGDMANCSEISVVSTKKKACGFDVSKMPDIIEGCFADSFGYPSGQPCVAVKLNRIYEFVPRLKPNVNESYVRVRCKGLHLADIDNVGPIEYFPQAGFDLAFFPYLGQKPYLSPVVFVKFPKVQRNVLVQVVCQPVNVVNIETRKSIKGDGRVNFELYILD